MKNYNITAAKEINVFFDGELIDTLAGWINGNDVGDEIETFSNVDGYDFEDLAGNFEPMSLVNEIIEGFNNSQEEE